MRAPDQKASLQDVARRIAHELAIDGDVVESDALTTIRLLRTLDKKIATRGKLKERGPIRGRRRSNTDDFTAILKSIKNLQKTLARVSPQALFLLLSGEDELSVYTFGSWDAQRKVVGRTRLMSSMLAYTHARCSFLLKVRPGAHGSADYRQHQVAVETWRFLKRHGKNPASGIASSLFGRLASLFYEGMTGTKNKDLERACKATLRLASEIGISEEGEVVSRGRIRLR